MKRIPSRPRPDWRAAVERRGLTWHTGETPYWSEDSYYEFSVTEIESIERATNELHARCLDAVQNVIDERRYGELRIPDHAIPLIERSWSEEPPSIYGRFDLAVAGDGGPPVMLEYNADTPTSLLEAGVIQWDWLRALHPHADQFNSIHERLVAVWRDIAPVLRQSRHVDPVVHFTSIDDPEDGMTVAYLAETASQAGLRASVLDIHDVGWDPDAREFVDVDGMPIVTLFKLYPWEWLIHEPFATHVGRTSTRFIEPAWKMILSNKGILAILWDLFPGHGNLVPAYLDEPNGMFEWVRKPLLSREGANVTVHTMTEHLQSTGDYGAEGHVFQQLATVPVFDGKRPVIGSWIIGQEAAGIGIRETEGRITGNTSRFIPHIIV